MPWPLTRSTYNTSRCFLSDRRTKLESAAGHYPKLPITQEPDFERVSQRNNTVELKKPIKRVPINISPVEAEGFWSATKYLENTDIKF